MLRFGKAKKGDARVVGGFGSLTIDIAAATSIGATHEDLGAPHFLNT